MISLPLQASEAWFHLLSRANFNKNCLPRNSVARESQVAVRDTADRLKAHLLIEHYRDERDLIIESLEESTPRIGAANDSSQRWTSTISRSSRFSSSSPIGICERRVQSGFDHILMDELQDTNPLQWKLMALIRRPDTFFAVGDINQSIFGFRYAEPELSRRTGRPRIARQGDR